MNKLFNKLLIVAAVASVGVITVLSFNKTKAKLKSNVEYDNPIGAKEPIEGEYTVVN